MVPQILTSFKCLESIVSLLKRYLACLAPNFHVQLLPPLSGSAACIESGDALWAVNNDLGSTMKQ